MSGPEPYGKPGALSAKELISRLQELADNRPIDGDFPIEWTVPAYFLGDMGALALVTSYEGEAER